MKRDLTVQPACRATLRSRNARVRPGASDDDASPRRSSLGNGGRILALVTRPHRPEERRYVPTDGSFARADARGVPDDHGGVLPNRRRAGWHAWRPNGR